MKKECSLTIIIAVRLESIERIENLISTTTNLLTNHDAKLIVIESNNQSSFNIKQILDIKINYIFQYDPDPIFFRTKYLNQLLKKVETPNVAVWDTDVLAPQEQFEKAYGMLVNNEADFVYPYDKYFLDTSPILRRMYLKEGKIEILLKNMKKMKEMYPPNPLGGAFLANMKAYRESGFENENFYGWGLEDGERYYRWVKLGYRIKRVPGPLFHLSHERGINSNFHDVDQHFNKKRELLNVVRARNQEVKADTKEEV